MSYHCTMTFDEYLALPRRDRFTVQGELTEFIAMDDGDESAPSFPRGLRKAL